MIRTPSRRASAAIAASRWTGAERFSTLLNLGASYKPWPTRRSRPALARRDMAWSTASRLPRSRKSFGVQTQPSLSWMDTLCMIVSAIPVIGQRPSRSDDSRHACQKSTLFTLLCQGGAFRDIPEGGIARSSNVRKSGVREGIIVTGRICGAR